MVTVQSRPLWMGSRARATRRVLVGLVGVWALWPSHEAAAVDPLTRFAKLPREQQLAVVLWMRRPEKRMSERALSARMYRVGKQLRQAERSALWDYLEDAFERKLAGRQRDLATAALTDVCQKQKQNALRIDGGFLLDTRIRGKLVRQREFADLGAFTEHRGNFDVHFIAHGTELVGRRLREVVARLQRRNAKLERELVDALTTDRLQIGRMQSPKDPQPDVLERMFEAYQMMLELVSANDHGVQPDRDDFLL